MQNNNTSFTKIALYKINKLVIAHTLIAIFTTGQLASADCNNRSDNKSGQTTGTIIGAIAGGLIGHTIGKGNGKTVATAGGAVAGAVIGNNIGCNEDNEDAQAKMQYEDSNYDSRSSGYNDNYDNRNHDDRYDRGDRRDDRRDNRYRLISRYDFDSYQREMLNSRSDRFKLATIERYTYRLMRNRERMTYFQASLILQLVRFDELRLDGLRTMVDTLVYEPANSQLIRNVFPRYLWNRVDRILFGR